MIVKTIALLLPVLLPSWRFFKTVAASPRVEMRIKHDGRWSDWQEARPIPQSVSLARMARRLIWNPKRNQQLYMVSLSERLVDQDGSHARADLDEMVRCSVTNPADAFEYRVVFLQREGARIVKFVEFESPELPVHKGAA